GFATGLESTYRRQGKPLPMPPRPRKPRLATLVLIGAFALFAVVFVGGFSGAIFYRFMPNDLTALWGLPGVLIAAGIGLLIATWFFWSSLGARPALFGKIPKGWRPPTSTPLPREPRGSASVRGLFEYGSVKACRHALVIAALAFPFLFLIENRN